MQTNDKGFTLVEAMVAILLLAVLLLGALTGLIASYKATSQNALRDEGIKLAQELINDARNTPYASLVVGAAAPYTITRQVTNTNVPYTIQQTVTEVVVGLDRMVQIDVSWAHQGQNYTHTATAIVGAI